MKVCPFTHTVVANNVIFSEIRTVIILMMRLDLFKIIRTY